ncbi:MAG TPA: molybdenum cofactor guanylyltransferase MobA [Magnetospirillaceae bacterium]
MAPYKTVAGVILAGGRSSRMGTNKALVEAGGMTLLERVKTRARPQVTALMLNVNGDRTPYMRFGLPMMADSVEDFAGPLAGILTGLEWARDNLPDIEWLASFPIDTPLIPPDLVKGLHDTISNTESTMACAASGGRIHPVVGLWPVNLAGTLRMALEKGVRKVEDWTGHYKTAFTEWPGGANDPFFNVNTASDLKSLETRLAASEKR